MPISVTLSAITTSVNLKQYSNAYLSISVTVSGMVIDSRPVQPLNRFSAIWVVPFSKVTVFKFSQHVNGPPYIRTVVPSKS